MRPVRLGILGAGLAVRHLHWPALQQLDGMFEVVAVCDVAEQAAAEVAGLVGGDPGLGAGRLEHHHAGARLGRKRQRRGAVSGRSSIVLSIQKDTL